MTCNCYEYDLNKDYIDYLISYLDFSFSAKNSYTTIIKAADN